MREQATRLLTLWMCAILCVASVSAQAVAGQFTTVYRFTGGANAGDPAGPLAIDFYGDVYGIADAAGAGNGVVFRLSQGYGRHWRETVLYTFPGGSPAERPNPGLVMGHDGALYGSTMFGGAGYAGSVFQLAPPARRGAWTYRELYAFPSNISARGAYPSGDLLVDAAGDVFGTTQAGGAHAGAYFCLCGVVYELSPRSGTGPWAESVLHTFHNPPDAGLPFGGLTPGPDGVLFGTSGQGGTGKCLDGSDVVVIGCGTVFGLSFAQGTWSEAVLFSFQQDQENGPFDDLTLGGDGALYGVAGLDVYRLVPPRAPGRPWRHQVLYEFPGGYDGIAPAGTVVFDRLGNLYGTTRSFGAAGVPTLYELSPAATSDAPWLETTLHRFANSKNFAEQPNSALTLGPDRTLYGTVGAGDGQDGYVFAYRP